MESGVIYTIGLALIGLAALVAAVAAPIFVAAGKKLKRQLETDYGKRGRQ